MFFCDWRIPSHTLGYCTLFYPVCTGETKIIFCTASEIILYLLNTTKHGQFNLFMTIEISHSKWRNQYAEKVTHIKGRQLDYAVILYDCLPFQNGNFSLRKEFTPSWSKFFPLRAVPYGMENKFYHNRLPHLNVTIFLLHTCATCVMGATPMTLINWTNSFQI